MGSRTSYHRSARSIGDSLIPMADSHGTILDPYPNKGKGKRKEQSSWRYFITSLVIAAAIPALLRLLVFGVFLVPTGSMLPNVDIGARVVTTGPALNLTPLGDVERGDMVVFRDEKDWTEQPNDHMLKRVIGLGGDTVKGLEDGTILINGEALEEPYATEATQNPFEVTVPEGHLWVMGDNRQHSADSRAYYGDKAFISQDTVSGVVMFVIPALPSLGISVHQEGNSSSPL